MSSVLDCWWPQERLGEAIDLLAAIAGRASARAVEPVETPRDPDPDWIAWAAARQGVEAVAVDAAVADLAVTLSRAAPAIVAAERTGMPGFYVLTGRGRRIALLDPALRRVRVVAGDLAAGLAEPFAEPLRSDIAGLLDLAGVAGTRRDRAERSLLAEHLSGRRMAGITLLRARADAPVARQAGRAGLWRLIGTILGGAGLLYGLEVAGWRLIGEGLLGGRIDCGWLAAWALILLTIVAVRTAVSWGEARLSIGLGRLLKVRLLAGAMALRPEMLRRGGSGQVIGKVIEAQALESLAFDGGLGVLTSAVEIVLATWVLAQGAAAFPHLALLLVWLALTAWLGWRYAGRLARWSDARLALTDDLVEAMVGHRTRLAQETPGRRIAHDDAALADYLAISRRMDTAGLAGLSALPALWLPFGIVALLPVILATTPSPGALAISVGGLLLAQRGFAGIGGGLAGLARARVAWRRVGDLLAGEQAVPRVDAPQPNGAAAEDAPLIDAEGISFTWPDSQRRVLDKVDLAIGRDDHILLEGASGGGKSTLAAILAGLERPQSGLLLLAGLDRATLGESWHRHVTAAPQFNDNHILSGTLAFNLLMGRRWPPTADDVAEAEQLCEQLGLGDLLRQMPGGIEQRVGETGWQLSHGERGRIFLARALLEGADLTILDETFAALDPANLAKALSATRQKSSALMVVAHP